MTKVFTKGLEDKLVLELAGNAVRTNRFSELGEYSRSNGASNPNQVRDALQAIIDQSYPGNTLNIASGDLVYWNDIITDFHGKAREKLGDTVKRNIHPIFDDIIGYISSKTPAGGQYELALGLIGAVPADEGDIGNAYAAYENVSRIAGRKDIDQMRRLLMAKNQPDLAPILQRAQDSVIKDSFGNLTHIAIDGVIKEISSHGKNDKTPYLDLNKVSKYVGTRIKELEQAESPEVMGVYERLAGLALSSPEYRTVLESKK